MTQSYTLSANGFTVRVALDGRGDEREAIVSGVGLPTPVRLIPQEARAFRFLLVHAGSVVLRDTLAEATRMRKELPSSGDIRRLICDLRRKIGWIEGVRSGGKGASVIGYILEPRKE